MIKKLLLITLLPLIMLISTLHCASAEPLPSADVFHLEASIIDANNIALSWETKHGYFLYRERIHFSNTGEEILTLGKINLPSGDVKQDPTTGNAYQIYRGKTRIVIPVLGHLAGKAKIIIDYQGCSDGGFCYPPVRKELLLQLDKSMAPTDAQLIDAELPSEQIQTSKAEQVLESNSLWLILLSFYGFGLLLAFTPCILPMVPILSGIIVGQKAKLTTAQAFLLSLTYVLSMSVTYAVIGMSIALVGGNIQAALQTPFVLTLTSALFVTLALSMFGFFELNLPESWRSALAKMTEKQQGGSYLGVAFMGSLSILVLSPCITPPLVGVLSFIAHSGDPLIGAIALFTLSIGMGTPLLLMGTAGGKILPKAGAWMVSIQKGFGFVFLVLAIYVLERVLPNSVIVLLWACLFITTAIFLGALQSSKTTSTLSQLKRGLGIVLLVYGSVLILALGLDDDTVLQPLAELSMIESRSKSALPVINISSIKAFKRELAEHKGKPIFIDFHAKWCTSCKVFERNVMAHADVKKALQDWVVIKVDLTERNERTARIERYFKVIAPPTLLFYNASGTEETGMRIVGEISREAFLKQLNRMRDK